MISGFNARGQISDQCTCGRRWCVVTYAERLSSDGAVGAGTSAVLGILLVNRDVDNDGGGGTGGKGIHCLWDED
jgi:hypothetical protein